MTDTIGSLIRAARERASLSQYRLAVALGVTPQTIAAWEAGRTEPRASDVRRLAETLGVDAARLIEAAR
jgi:transcriptional regulator with XRE-family HTH domain